jgi:VCBS repeat-containing protein
MANITIQYRNASSPQSVPISGEQVFDEQMVRSIAKIDLLGAGAVKIEEAEDWLLLFPDGSTLRLKKYVVLLAEDPANVPQLVGFDAVPTDTGAVEGDAGFVDLEEEDDAGEEEISSPELKLTGLTTEFLTIAPPAAVLIDNLIVAPPPAAEVQPITVEAALPPVIPDPDETIVDPKLTAVDDVVPVDLTIDFQQPGVTGEQVILERNGSPSAVFNPNDRSDRGEKLFVTRVQAPLNDDPATSTAVFGPPGRNFIRPGSFTLDDNLNFQTAETQGWLHSTGVYGEIYVGRATGNVIYNVDVSTDADRKALKGLGANEYFEDVFEYRITDAAREGVSNVALTILRINGTNDLPTPLNDDSVAALAGSGVPANVNGANLLGFATESGSTQATVPINSASWANDSSGHLTGSIFNNDTDAGGAELTPNPAHGGAFIAGEFKYLLYSRSASEVFKVNPNAQAAPLGFKVLALQGPRVDESEAFFNDPSNPPAGERILVAQGAAGQLRFYLADTVDPENNVAYTAGTYRYIRNGSVVTDNNGDPTDGPSDVFVLRLKDFKNVRLIETTIDIPLSNLAPNSETVGSKPTASFQGLATGKAPFSVLSVTSQETADSDVLDINAPVGVLQAIGRYGVLEINRTTGTYTYTPRDGEFVVDSLKPGVEVSETFTYRIADANPFDLFSLRQEQIAALTVHLRGTNDQPEITANLGLSTDEDTAQLLAPNRLITSDIDDAPNELTYTLNGLPLGTQLLRDGVDIGIGGTFTQQDINQGKITFNPGLAFQYLGDLGGGLGELAVVPINFQVADGGENGAVPRAGAFTLNISGVNDAPILKELNGSDAAPTATITLPENILDVLTLKATDVDLIDVLTFADIGAENGLFDVAFDLITSGQKLSFLVAPDFENPVGPGNDNTYQITVRVADGKGGFDTQAVTINVTNENDNVPVITSDGGADAVKDVDENTTFVATITATDADDPDALNGNILNPLTYTLVDEATSPFQIVRTAQGSATLSFKQAPDFESAAPRTYTVQVLVSDGLAGHVDMQTLTVNVINKNDNLPQFTLNGGNDIAAIVDENTAFSLNITATDADDPDVANNVILNSLTYSLAGADAALFDISKTSQGLAVLSLKQTLNFEASTLSAAGTNTYTVQVLVTDGDNTHVDTQTITLDVNDLPEAPRITFGGGGEVAAPVSVDEGVLAVATVTASDEDAGSVLTYSIVPTAEDAGSVDALRFAINSSTGALTFAALPDFELPLDAGLDNSYTLKVKVTDQTGRFDVQTLTVNVNDISSVRITSDGGADTVAMNFAEGGTAIKTITAVEDEANRTLRFLVGGGQDQDFFQIDEITGAFSFKVAPDFEALADGNGNNVYRVRVQAAAVTNGGQLDVNFRDTQIFDITLTDVNEAPTLTVDALVPANENANAAAILADVDGLDGDVGGGNDATSNFEDLTYSIVAGNGAGLFEVDADGQISLISGQALNFETAQSHTLTVRVTDGPGLFAEQIVTIDVADVNEAPSLTVDLTPVPHPEDVADNVVLADVDGTDPDAGGGNDAINNFEDLTYSITAGNLAGLFEIDGDGQISLALGKTLDFETATSHNLTVRVTDGGGLFAEQSVVIQVTDVPGSAPSDLIEPASGSELDTTKLLAFSSHLSSGAGESLPSIDEVLAGPSAEGLPEIDLDALVAVAAVPGPAQESGGTAEASAAETPTESEASGVTKPAAVASAETPADLPAAPVHVPNFDDVHADAPAAVA